MELVWLTILVGIIVFAVRMHRQKQDDAEAFYWATVREPIIFIQATAYDKTAQAMRDEAVENLKKYGNQFLTEKDVWLCLYRIDMGIFERVEAIEVNHSRWFDEACREMQRKKADWIKMKSGYIQDNAGHVFAGQQPYYDAKSN